MTYLILKAAVSGALVVAISEIAKRDNWMAAIIHSLPITSLIAFVWMWFETKDSGLIGRHAYGTFWFVLPTLPMFLMMPWLVRKFGGFWPGLAVGIVLSIGLYALTMKVLKAANVQL